MFRFSIERLWYVKLHCATYLASLYVCFLLYIRSKIINRSNHLLLQIFNLLFRNVSQSQGTQGNNHAVAVDANKFNAIWRVTILLKLPSKEGAKHKRKKLLFSFCPLLPDGTSRISHPIADKGTIIINRYLPIVFVLRPEYKMMYYKIGSITARLNRTRKIERLETRINSKIKNQFSYSPRVVNSDAESAALAQGNSNIFELSRLFRRSVPFHTTRKFS